MPKSSRKPVPPRKRVADYRQRMRAAGLRQVQIWVPDTRAPGFAEQCRKQARAIARDDPAGAEIDRFIDEIYEWPEE
jgi:hypothetical protein